MIALHRIPTSLLKPLNFGFNDKQHRAKFAFELLDKFANAVEVSRSEHGYQSGALVDLRKSNKETVFIGDIHGEVDHLEQILLHGNLYERLSNNEINLVFLGDLFHYEDKKRADDMSSSVQILHLIQQLKSEFPHNVHWILGNHDLLNLSVAKAGIVQNKAMSAFLTQMYEQPDEAQDQTYSEKLSSVLSRLPIAAVGDHFVAIHAGPIKDRDNPLQSLQQLEFTDSEFYDLPHEVQSALCCRHILRNIQTTLEPIAYDLSDIDAFLEKCGVTDGYLISGHTPHPDRVNWHWQMGKQIILHASTYEYGYATLVNQNLKLHTVARDINIEGSKTVLFSPSNQLDRQIEQYYAGFDFIEFAYINAEPTIRLVSKPTEQFDLYPNVKLEFNDNVLPLGLNSPSFPLPIYLNWVSNTDHFLSKLGVSSAIRKGYFLLDSTSAKSASDIIIHIQNDSEAWLKILDNISPESIMLSSGQYGTPDGTERLVIAKIDSSFCDSSDTFQIRSLNQTLTIS